MSEAPSRAEREVLVLPTTRRDGEVCCALLAKAAMDCSVARSIDEVCDRIRQSIGAVILTDDPKTHRGFPALFDALADQPKWSDVPIILLSRPGADLRTSIGRFGDLTNVTVLDRPTSSRALLSAVAAAVRGRERQYQLRDQLRSLERAQSALQESADQMAHADRRKDEFLATLAHELRNPLAPIRTGLQALARADGDATITARLRAIMERQLGQMVRLIDDLLDVSRISSGKVILQKQRMDLRSAIEMAVEGSQPTIAAEKHRFEFEMPASALWIDGDVFRLSQVVTNILNNAAKYTPPGGRIRLRVSKDDHEASIEISDNGLGIPPEMMDEVFNLFTQVNRTLDRAQGGLGVGLSLVRELILLHGGTVSAHSDGLGKGSRFVVKLPLLAESPEDPVSPLPVATPTFDGADLRILIIDDIVDVAETMALLLDLEGYTTRTANNGADALEAVVEFDPDVVLCDIGLPVMDGHEIARRLRAMERSKPLTLVAMTGWGGQDDIRRTRESGYDFHLVKPVSVDAVKAILHSRAATE